MRDEATPVHVDEDENRSRPAPDASTKPDSPTEITNVALLFGAEIDAELERGRQLQAGIPVEEIRQLPLRDTSVIDKSAKKRRRGLLRGRLLRRTRGRGD